MRKLLLFILIGFSTLLIAQPLKVQNLQRFEVKKIHFGFSLGVNSGGFSLQRKAFSFVTDSLASLNVVNQSGFNLGIVSDWHLNRYFHLRFVPTLVFGQRNLEYNFIGDAGEPFTVLQEIESTYADLPLLVKYSSARLNNFAAYIIAGGKYSIDFASNENVSNEDIDDSIVKLRKYTTSAEVGIGTDFFLPYFKFALEIKMSYALQDALIRDNTELSSPIDRIVPKMFFFSLLFEG